MLNRCVKLLLILSLQFGWAASTAGQATIDLSHHRFEDGNAVLYGSWEFYDNVLKTPDELQGLKSTLVSVPSLWFGFNEADAKLGVATFRTKVLLPVNRSPEFSIYFSSVRCASKIWENNILEGGLGTVGNKQEYKSNLSAIMITAPPGVNELEIVVQAANFDYMGGTLATKILIGNTNSILHQVRVNHGIGVFLGSGLIAMFIYLSIMFLLYPDGKSFLYLGLICLSIAVRTFVIEGGNLLLPNLTGYYEWKVWKQIGFFFTYALLGLLPLYVSSVFPAFSMKKLKLCFLGVSGGLCIITLFTPHYVYGQLLDFYFIALILALVYTSIIITKAFKMQNNDAKTLLLGIICSSPFIMLEILKYTRLVHFNIQLDHMVEFGVLIFLLFQVYVLAKQFAASYSDLKVLVDDQTRQLIQSNQVKESLLSILSHDVKGPLNSIKLMLNMYNKNLVSEAELSSFMKKIESMVDGTLLLSENILSWIKNQIQGIDVRMENINLKAIIDQHVNLLQSIAAQKKIQLVNKVANNLTIWADKNILSLVLRNLTSNSIKFSHEGATIIFSGFEDSGKVYFGVSDEGVGISQETIEQLLQPNNRFYSMSGTKSETGTGFGLKLAQEYLKKMGAELLIKSKVNHGSTFYSYFQKSHI